MQIERTTDTYFIPAARKRVSCFGSAYGFKFEFNEYGRDILYPIARFDIFDKNISSNKESFWSSSPYFYSRLEINPKDCSDEARPIS